MQETLSYYLGFSYFVGIGPTRFQALVDYMGTVQEAYHAPLERLKHIISPALALKFVDFRQKFKPEEELLRLEQAGITLLTREDVRFPAPLLALADAPLCLYVKGDLHNYDFVNDQFFAVVGTRSPTSYGEQVTKKFSSELAAAGFVVVSGMALGVDKIAHEAALDQKGRTIAFLGCGVNIIYPPSNTTLYHRIIREGGLVISEFPPEMFVRRGMFVVRNRLISGLSRGVLVAEGLKDSGSLITARCAAEQGKTVFAPPAPLTSVMSEAPNSLLKEGAKLVTSLDDILEEFNLTVQPQKQKDLTAHLQGNEKLVVESLMAEPKRPDDLAHHCNITVVAVLSALSSLEILGTVEKNMEGKYQVKIA